MPEEIESPITAKWSQGAPTISGILRWENSMAGRTSKSKTKTDVTTSRDLTHTQPAADQFAPMNHITNAPRNIALIIHGNGGQAITIIANASHAVVFLQPSAQRRVKYGEVAITNRSSAAPK
jgi:hypothetical protein